MATIAFEIKSCMDCPFVRIDRVYTADSWETVHRWSCKKEQGSMIAGYVEPFEEVDIPDWCPIIVKTN